VRRALLTHGVRPPRARYRETIARAIADIKGQRELPSASLAGIAAGSPTA
jgi:SulP family sulfate permease